MHTLGKFIIPHRHRPERRALWRKNEKMLTYEYLDSRGTGRWVADYTKYESEVETPYFNEFYDLTKMEPLCP